MSDTIKVFPKTAHTRQYIFYYEIHKINYKGMHLQSCIFLCKLSIGFDLMIYTFIQTYVFFPIFPHPFQTQHVSPQHLQIFLHTPALNLFCLPARFKTHHCHSEDFSAIHQSHCIMNVSNDRKTFLEFFLLIWRGELMNTIICLSTTFRNWLGQPDRGGWLRYMIPSANPWFEGWRTLPQLVEILAPRLKLIGWLL